MANASDSSSSSSSIAASALPRAAPVARQELRSSAGSQGATTQSTPPAATGGGPGGGGPQAQNAPMKTMTIDSKPTGAPGTSMTPSPSTEHLGLQTYESDRLASQSQRGFHVFFFCQSI
jgi:hypothetical protein